MSLHVIITKIIFKSDNLFWIEVSVFVSDSYKMPSQILTKAHAELSVECQHDGVLSLL